MRQIANIKEAIEGYITDLKEDYLHG